MSITTLSPPSSISVTWLHSSSLHHDDCSGHPKEDEADPHIGEHSVQDAGFIRTITAALMHKCILHRWVPDDDERIEDALPSPIVDALHLGLQDRNAIGMSKALLALTDLQERRRVLIQMILALHILR